MAKLFGQGSSAPSTNSVDTLVGRQTEVNGDLRFTGGLHVDGCVKGRVTTSDRHSVLSIAETGVIEGDVNVPKVMVAGHIHGDVRAASKLTIRATARITGNVYYRVVEIEAGARINGQLVYDAVAGADSNASPVVDELSQARRLKSLMS